MPIASKAHVAIAGIVLVGSLFPARLPSIDDRASQNCLPKSRGCRRRPTRTGHRCAQHNVPPGHYQPFATSQVQRAVRKFSGGPVRQLTPDESDAVHRGRGGSIDGGQYFTGQRVVAALQGHQRNNHQEQGGQGDNGAPSCRSSHRRMVCSTSRRFCVDGFHYSADAASCSVSVCCDMLVSRASTSCRSAYSC